jgi:hypothetical protein
VAESSAPGRGKKAAVECLANVSSSGLGDRSFLLCRTFPDGLYDFIAHGLPKSQQLARVDFGYLAFGKVEFFGLLLFHRASPEDLRLVHSWLLERIERVNAA